MVNTVCIGFPKASKLVSGVLFLLALTVLVGVIASSLSHPVFPWDSWAYHLPFSAWLWNIGNSRQTFLMAEGIHVFFNGFPLLAEYLQGGAWVFFGNVRAVSLINSVALVFFIIVAVRAVRANFSVMTFGLLSVPLVAIHAVSSYIDLFVAVAISFQFLSSIIVEREVCKYFPNSSLKRLLVWLSVFVISAGVAGNSKYMAAVVSIAMAGFFLLYVAFNFKEYGRRNFLIIAVAVLLASASASFVFVRNYIDYRNPFYPIKVDIPALHVSFPGPATEYKNYPDYIKKIGPFARPVNWVLSVSEVDWGIRGVRQEYSVDSNTGDSPLHYGPARTGGYWGGLIIFSLTVFAVLVGVVKKKGAEEFSSIRFFVWMFLFLTVLCACMPQSHELRYYLYWPFLLVFGVSFLIYAARVSKILVWAFSVVYMLFFILSESMLGFPLAIYPVLPDAVYMRTLSEGPELDLAKKYGGICLGPEYRPVQFMYSPAINGGNYAIEQGWENCENYPMFIKK